LAQLSHVPMLRNRFRIFLAGEAIVTHLSSLSRQSASYPRDLVQARCAVLGQEGKGRKSPKGQP
jgi:hypothetical protein